MTYQEAAKTLLRGIQNPDDGDGISGFDEVKWQAVYNAMREDHAQNIAITGHDDWLSVLVAALYEIAGDETP